MTASIAYLGRAVALRPAKLGVIFRDDCTVQRRYQERNWEDGKMRTTNEVEDIPLHWYTKDASGDDVFCAYVGYGPRIERTLAQRGLEVVARNLVDHGLGNPDLQQIKGTIWRKRQKEVFAKLLAYDRGIIKCPMGFGKTFLIKKLAKVYPKAEIIITVNSKDIALDVYEDLCMDPGPHVVGMIGGGKNVVRRINVVVSQSLHKAPKDVNLVLADECHALYTKNYVKKLNKFHRAKIFGLSATPEGRGDGADGFGEALFGPIIADVTYQEGVEGGNVVPINTWLYNSPTGPNLRGISDKTYVDRAGIWANEARNELIVKSVDDALKHMGQDSQVLIMVDTIEHAYRLGQMLPEFTIVSGEPTAQRLRTLINKGVITKDQEICTPKLRQQYKEEFAANTLKRVIATKVWSKGVDFRELSILVRADGLASEIDSDQVPGRLSRLPDSTEKTYGLLIDFMDTFSSNLQGRSLKRQRVYKKNGWQIQHR